MGARAPKVPRHAVSDKDIYAKGNRETTPRAGSLARVLPRALHQPAPTAGQCPGPPSTPTSVPIHTDRQFPPLSRDVKAPQPPRHHPFHTTHGGDFFTFTLTPPLNAQDHPSALLSRQPCQRSFPSSTSSHVLGPLPCPSSCVYDTVAQLHFPNTSVTFVARPNATSWGCAAPPGAVASSRVSSTAEPPSWPISTPSSERTQTDQKPP